MATDATRDQPTQHIPDLNATTAVIPLRRPPVRSQQTYHSAAPDRPVRHSRGRSFLRGLRTAVVVLVLLAAAVAGGLYLTRNRLAADTYVKLADAVLTTQPVPVGTTSAGSVTSIAVAPQHEVSAGQAVATVAITTPNGTTATKVLRAPIAGIVFEVNVPSGAVASAGQPVVTLYDPARLTFQASASVAELRRFRLGMTAKITAKGLGAPIGARLDRVVPRVATDRSTGRGPFTVVFVPDVRDAATVRTLVPGLPFTATVDTKSATDGPPAVRSVQK
jgi:hypothetical protein